MTNDESRTENEPNDPADGARTEGSPEQLERDDPAIPPSTNAPDKDAPQSAAPGSGAALPKSE